MQSVIGRSQLLEDVSVGNVGVIGTLVEIRVTYFVVVCVGLYKDLMEQ